jgi:hypothetical protein
MGGCPQALLDQLVVDRAITELAAGPLSEHGVEECPTGGRPVTVNHLATIQSQHVSERFLSGIEPARN